MIDRVSEKIDNINNNIVPIGYKRTKVGIIPDDWKLVKIGDIGEFLKGKGISKKELVEDGIPCIRYGEIYTKHHNYIKNFISFIPKSETHNAKLIMQGDILFAGSGETLEEIGKSVAYLEDKEAYAGGDIVILRPVQSNNSKYLGFALNGPLINSQRRKVGQGHSVVHIYSRDLKSLLLPLPSLSEQNKIANILSTWDKAIDLKEELIKQKKEQKRGLMQLLLTGKKRLKEFTGEWNEVKLKQVGKLYQPQTISQSQLKASGYPVYGANGLIGYYDQYNHDTWQIMITCRGSTCGTVNKSKAKSWITGNAMVLNTDENKDVVKDFVYYLCLNSNFQKLVSGSGQPQITRNPLETFKIIMPTDLKEQKAIADVLSTADKEINLLEQQLDQLKQQKKGLMQLLLTGIVRVKD
ncbi:restriction endonuclease subunit S [Haloplasma contractile]|nr:restriction endonuclease subunit S [Haloplasma contractile]